MRWNYRIIQFMHEDEPYLRIHEVYYDEEGKPRAYAQGAASVGSESISGMGLVIAQMKRALEMPILKATDFPDK